MALTIRWLAVSASLLFLGLVGVAGCGGSSNGRGDGSDGLDGSTPATGGIVEPGSGGETTAGGGGVIGAGGASGGNVGQGGTVALDGGSTVPTCGQPGTPCCDGNSCSGGGCCVSKICMAENTTCVNLGEGICKAGSCGVCGGAQQPCCGANPAKGVCTAAGTTCSNGTCAKCGDPGSPCCASAGSAGTCSGANAICGSTGVCATCGLPGSQCCANQACTGGCCVNGMCMTGTTCVGPADAGPIDVNVQAEVRSGTGGVPGSGGASGTNTASTGGAGGAATTVQTGGAGGTTTTWTPPPGCGDSLLVPPEACDDGNTVPFDGCSSDCRIEPDCSAGTCKSTCGDGFVIGEECDDGNAVNGDGCSSACTVEPGWTCAQPPIGDTMKVPVVYRDFKFSKDATGGNDFENGVTGSYKPTSGMANSSLDAKGKPVLSSTAPAAAHVASAASFATWYSDVSGANHATASKMTLWNDGKGNYVNRYGANGEQWNITTPANMCGSVTDAKLDADGNPIPCTFKYQYDPDTNPTGGKTDCQKMEDLGYTQVPGSCHSDSGTYKALYITAKVDGNPLFFPVDGDTFSPASELVGAQIPPYYDAGKTYPYDVDAKGNKILHNFSFTSEIHYWFKYEADQTYTLDVAGDDDVWVFVNRKLAIDLGGVHTPVDGSIVITNGNGNTTVTAFDAYGAANPPIKSTVSLGLEDGNVYEIAVFQAERQSTSSTFKLTLAGFNTAPSVCLPN